MSDDTTITNRRLDATDHEPLYAMARAGADAFGYTADLDIDPRLARLLRLLVSQINGRSYCLDLHAGAARDAGISRAAIDTLPAWRQTDLHDEATRAALAYTEALTDIAGPAARVGFPDAHAALAEHFTDGEILDIVGVVVNMNIWTRLKLAEGATPGHA